MAVLPNTISGLAWNYPLQTWVYLVKDKEAPPPGLPRITMLSLHRLPYARNPLREESPARRLATPSKLSELRSPHNPFLGRCRILTLLGNLKYAN